jgi:hypothetical protein
VRLRFLPAARLLAFIPLAFFRGDRAALREGCAGGSLRLAASVDGLTGTASGTGSPRWRNRIVGFSAE